MIYKPIHCITFTAVKIDRRDPCPRRQKQTNRSIITVSYLQSSLLYTTKFAFISAYVKTF